MENQNVHSSRGGQPYSFITQSEEMHSDLALLKLLEINSKQSQHSDSDDSKHNLPHNEISQNQILNYLSVTQGEEIQEKKIKSSRNEIEMVKKKPFQKTEKFIILKSDKKKKEGDEVGGGPNNEKKEAKPINNSNRKLSENITDKNQSNLSNLIKNTQFSQRPSLEPGLALLGKEQSQERDQRYILKSERGGGGTEKQLINSQNKKKEDLSSPKKKLQNSSQKQENLNLSQSKSNLGGLKKLSGSQSSSQLLPMGKPPQSQNQKDTQLKGGAFPNQISDNQQLKINVKVQKQNPNIGKKTKQFSQLSNLNQAIKQLEQQPPPSQQSYSISIHPPTLNATNMNTTTTINSQRNTQVTPSTTSAIDLSVGTLNNKNIGINSYLKQSKMQQRNTSSNKRASEGLSTKSNLNINNILQVQQAQQSSNVDLDLKYLQQFVEKWGLQIKYKNAYTRSELVDLIRQLDIKLLQIDQVTEYERSKAEEYKEESRLLNEQIEMQSEQIRTIQKEFLKYKDQYGKKNDLLQKLEECSVALKETLLNSLVCIDFYKDVESYIQQNRYEQQEEMIQRHFDVIESLINQHGLNSMDFEAEQTQKLIESIGELLRLKEIENKIISINLFNNDEAIVSSEDDGLTPKNLDSYCLKVKITKMKKELSQKQLITGLNGRGQSAQRPLSSDRMSMGEKGGSGAPCYHPQTRLPNRHLNCCQGNNQGIKIELHNRNQQVIKLKDQLQGRIKKILELKAELQRERDIESQKRKHEQFKETITRLEKEYNQQVIQNTNLQLEVKQLKEENDSYMQKIVQMRENMRQAQNETEQFKKVLKDKEGFRELEKTVTELSNLLISKKDQQLNTSQKLQLKAIFGNSAILHQLRISLQELEEFFGRQGVLLTQSLQMNLDFQEIIEDQWSQLKQLYLYMKDVDEQDLNHYQLILMNKQLKEKWNEETIDQYERDFAQRLVNFKDIKTQLQKDCLAEKMSRQMIEDKDKMALMQMMIQNNKSKAVGSFKEGRSMITPQKEITSSQLLGGEPSTMKNYSENQLYKQKQLTRIMSENAFIRPVNFVTGDSEQNEKNLPDDFQKMFEFSKDLSKEKQQSTQMLNHTLFSNKGGEQQPASNQFMSPDMKINILRTDTQTMQTEVFYEKSNQKSVEQRKNLKRDRKSSAQSVIPPIKFNQFNLQNNNQANNDEKMQKLPQQIHDNKKELEDFDKISLGDLSQLESTYLLNDPSTTRNNQSVVRGNAKKILRNKLKRIREENQQLKQVLKMMQEKLQMNGNTSVKLPQYMLAGGAYLETDQSMSQFASTHKTNNQQNLLQNQSFDNQMGIVGYSMLQGGGNNNGMTSLRGTITSQNAMQQQSNDFNDIDTLNIILCQAQAFEEMLLESEGF